MKTILLHIAFFFCAVVGYGQNLVVNPSFEDTINCPYQSGDIAKATGWMSFCGSPDYFKSCNQSDWGVPVNIDGYQMAASGNAYAGFMNYTDYSTNAREFPACSLLNPLNIGTKYYVSFKVALSLDPFYNPTNCASNNIGARFTTGLTVCDTILPNNAQVYTNSVITDSTNWTRITGAFIADSAYTHIVVGNFFDNANTDTVKYFNSWWSNFSYYYLDDVCVGTDSAFVYGYDGVTGITENKTNLTVNFYPNPVKDYLFVNTNFNESVNVSIYNLLGEKLMNINETSSKSFSIDLGSIPFGMLIINFKTSNQSTSYKLQKM